MNKLKVHHRCHCSNLKKLAKCNRKQLTQTEQKLWKLLRNKFFNATKFKWQIIIGKHIVGFVCFSKKLIVELGGGRHNGVITYTLPLTIYTPSIVPVVPFKKVK
jgi:very-short-patch-repair endonuclease